MSRVALGAIALALGFAVFARAGVDPSDWNVVLIATGVISASYFGFSRLSFPPLPRHISIAIAAIIAITILQVVPLPLALIRIVSPNRADIAAALGNIAVLPRYATLSLVPYQTAQYVLTISGYALVFLLIRNLTQRAIRRSPESAWRCVWPLLVIGVLEAILGLYQASEGPKAFASGTYNSRDHFAGLLEMILPFAATYPFMLFERKSNDVLRLVLAISLVASAALMLGAIIASLSRMAFLASLASLCLCVTLALVSRSARHGGRRRTRLLPAFGVAALLAIAGLVLLPSGALLARFSELASTDQITSDARAQIWRDTMGLIKAYPVFGCGLGAYESGFLRYKTVAPMNTVDYAHNDYLQVLAEMGIFGFAAGVVFVGGVVLRAARRVWRANSLEEQYLSIACLASLTAMLLHSMVDFNMYVPANGMVLAWVAGIAALELSY